MVKKSMFDLILQNEKSNFGALFESVNAHFPYKTPKYLGVFLFLFGILQSLS